MCELLAVSATKKILINPFVKTLQSHSINHPDGWGMAVFDNEKYKLVKECLPAYESKLLDEILSAPIYSRIMIGHIRLATMGKMIDENCHPFFGVDSHGTGWTVAHNGTIFHSDILDKYKQCQKGSTDSERILLHIIERASGLNKDSLDEYSRFKMLDDIVLNIVPQNKLNLLVYDGDLLYIHTNMAHTLYYKKIEGGVVFATTALDEDKDWEPLPMMRLFAYKDGEKVYEGTAHSHEYFLEESK